MTIETEKQFHIFLTSSVLVLTIVGSLMWFMGTPIVTEGQGKTSATFEIEEIVLPKKYVIIHLDTMNLELHDGSSTPIILKLLSQGKPGSYYETIGGTHITDYKKELHFSSIGHVYMPYSVHLFGNYFIHGIPYYPDGTTVSSAFSGGCIRLTNENAKIVYDFVEAGTPISVVRGKGSSFEPTTRVSSTLISSEMTKLMVATISLEALTQDNKIMDPSSTFLTTRKALLNKYIKSGDSSIAELFAKSIGEEQFVELMNEKAVALGLSNTHFGSVSEPVATTYEDYNRMMSYISTYKSYILTLEK